MQYHTESGSNVQQVMSNHGCQKQAGEDKRQTVVWPLESDEKIDLIIIAIKENSG